MGEITKIKVNGDPESSYQLYSRNEEFAKRSDIQPDWNQNDETAPDYVKNRTHWTEPEILDVIFQQDDVALYDATDFLQSEQSLVLSEELVVGDTYNVNIDGVDHYVVCYTRNSEVHLGKESPDRFMLFGSGSSATLYLYNFNYGSTVRLTITHITPSKIHKLDAKYLPDEVIDSIDNAQSTASNAQSTAKKAQTAANSKMNANNPVGTGSFSMGRKDNSVVGNKSHAEGNNTTASGQCSHAEGYNTTASGYGSHAEGNNTTASGYDAHAEGFRTTSSGDYSHAEGNNTTASGEYSHVQGKYNVADSQNKYAHIVGNGAGESTRSNAHTLDWNGVPWFSGRPQFGGTAQDQGSQTVMANGDKEIILASSTANSTKKFKITVDDSGTLTATEVI